MAKTAHSVRLGEVLERRVQAFANDRGINPSEAIRQLLEKGLAVEGIDFYASPLTEAISRTVHSEFALIQRAMEEQNRATEDRIAKVCSHGTKAALANLVQVVDLSRALIDIYRSEDPVEMYEYYSNIGGRLQYGESLSEIRPPAEFLANEDGA